MQYEEQLGMLATIEDGGQRLRPLAFLEIDGEFWTSVSRRAQTHLREWDGQHVEVLFVNKPLEDRVHGVLACSDDGNDRRRLAEYRDDPLLHDDGDVVILKVIPAAGEGSRQRAA